MITINTNPVESVQPMTEGIIQDSIKSLSGVDTAKIKEEWKSADKNKSGYEKIVSKAKSVNDHGVKGVADKADELNKKARDSSWYNDGRSIIARARNSVLQFPIYVTQTIRANEAQIISKLFERVYTTLVQTALAQHPIIDENEVNELLFLRRFHSNLQENTDLYVNKYYTPIDEMDAMLQESVFHSEKITENCTVEFRVISPNVSQQLIKECARLTNEPLQGLSYLREANISDMNKISASDDAKRNKTVERSTTSSTDNNETTVSRTYLTDRDLREMAIDKANLSKRELDVLDMSKPDMEQQARTTYPGNGKEDLRKQLTFDLMDRQTEAKKKVNDAMNTLKDDIKKGKVKGYGFDGNRYYKDGSSVKTVKGKRTDTVTSVERKKADDVIKSVDAPRLLRDADIKKINGMLPYTIEASFRVKGTNGGLDYDVHFIIGIKSVMHLIRVQDLKDDLRDIVTGDIKSLRKIKYKTGEIGFTDYLFNIKQLKADATKRMNGNKRWLSTLKRLGEYDKMKNSLLGDRIRRLNNNHTPMPNGTMILAQTDVTTLTNETGIDLSIIGNARRLTKALFLLGFAIVDSSAGTMRVFFPDMDSDWDVQSLSSIDSELAKTDNSQLMRELQRYINK